MAISDPGGILASPFTIIDRKDDTIDIKAIIDIVNQQQVGLIVAGLPRSMNGTIGKQAEKVQDFVRKLIHLTEVPVKLSDERLTTVSAKRLKQAANSRRSKKKVRYDAMAAALILQGYLDETHQQ